MKLSDAEHLAIDREASEAPARRERTDDLLDRIASLEDRLFIATLLLQSALELLDRRAAEHARTLELVAAVEHIDRLVGQRRLAVAA